MTKRALVIAHYNEALEWVLPILHHENISICIQSKGDPTTTSIPTALKPFIRPLPNIGLDQHSYLDYIIRNYADLPDEIMFTQACASDHLDCLDIGCNLGEKYWVKDTVSPNLLNRSIQDIILLMFNQVSYHGHTLNARVYTYANGVYCNDRNLKVSSFYDEADTGMRLGEWFEKFVRPDFPNECDMLWFKNGIFGVAKRYILTRPKSFYQRLIDQIKTTRGEVIHYMERSWYYILNMDLVFPGTWLAVPDTFSKSIFQTLDNIIVASCNEHQCPVEGSLFFFGGTDISYNQVFFHKQYNLFQLATKADYILEIGFNAGHSAALMLLANPRSKILHFDLKEHPYVDPCYQFLQSVFGAERFIGMVVGDSRKTIPTFETLCKFDLIHIDGGHADLVAMSDILNCERLASTNATVVIDDFDMVNIKGLVTKFVNQGVLAPYKDGPPLQTYDDVMYHFVGKYALRGSVA